MMEIAHQYVTSRLSYDEESGLFVWKPIQEKKALDALWNRKHAGTIAGGKTPAGYVSVRFLGRRILAHRLAWFYVHKYWPIMVDHINGVHSDNRIANLREVGFVENARNCPIAKNNTSGVRGVSWKSKPKAWCAAIYENNKTVHLGNFKSFSDAVDARKAAELRLGYHPNHGRPPATNQ